MPHHDPDARSIRLLAWAGTAALILLPLALLKAIDRYSWSYDDLPFAFVMIAAVGVAAEVALRLPGRWTQLAGALLAVATALLLVLGNLAVGFAGSEEEPINIIFFVAPIVALAGCLVARFRPRGMATALVAAAASQVIAGLVALFAGHFTGPLTVAFTGLWLVSALLLHRGRQDRQAI